MSARNLEFTGAGFDGFNLASETQRDGAPLLADKIARIEAEAVENKQQCTFLAADSYRIREVRAQVVHDSAEIETAPRILNAPAASVLFWREIVENHPMFDPEKEAACVVMLNRRSAVRGWHFLSLGTATAALVHPREVLRICLVAGACAFVVMHNHPSGDPSPSAADLNATRNLREAARAVDLSFVDHCIIGRVAADPRCQGFYSFRGAGII